jgi:hypothetical protein
VAVSFPITRQHSSSRPRTLEQGGLRDCTHQSVSPT